MFLPRSLVGLFLLAIAGASIGEQLQVRRYSLSERDSIELRVPSSWKHKVKRAPDDVATTIGFRPKVGSEFEIFVTALWPAQKEVSSLDASQLKQLVQNEADAIKSQAAETNIEIKEMSGTAGGGYYFFATDKASKLGEYKYMTQGMLRLQALTVTFTILTNDPERKVSEEALIMLQTAKYR